MIAAIGFVALITVLAGFQVALACGAPLGQFAWGGQHPGTLPIAFRIGSAVSVLIYGFFATIVLDQAGLIDVYPEAFAQVAIWFVVGFLALGMLANAASRSKPERVVMTPVALVLAVLSLVVALTGG